MLDLSYYPYPFLKNETEYSKEKYVETVLLADDVLCFDMDDFALYYECNRWESDIIGDSIVRILYLKGDRNKISELESFLNSFIFNLRREFSSTHVYVEVPTEDVVLFQILGQLSFRLIETRLIHFNDKLKVNEKSANLIRLATLDEAEKMKFVAMSMRNDFDRYHADVEVANSIADNYLGEYAYACIIGYVDEVIAPNLELGKSNSFIALNHRVFDSLLNTKISQIVLTAVDSKTNKGWYRNLVEGAIDRSLKNQSEVLINTTQSTNKAVIHVLESLGFKLGRVTHVFSKKIR